MCSCWMTGSRRASHLGLRVDPRRCGLAGASSMSGLAAAARTFSRAERGAFVKSRAIWRRSRTPRWIRWVERPTSSRLARRRPTPGAATRDVLVRRAELHDAGRCRAGVGPLAPARWALSSWPESSWFSGPKVLMSALSSNALKVFQSSSYAVWFAPPGVSAGGVPHPVRRRPGRLALERERLRLQA